MSNDLEQLLKKREIEREEFLIKQNKFFDIITDDEKYYSEINRQNKKLKLENEIKKTSEIECCVCYDNSNSFMLKTNCNHDICISCILQIKKHECPMCREKFPQEINKLLSGKNITKNINVNRHFINNQPDGIDNWFCWNGSPATL